MVQADNPHRPLANPGDAERYTPVQRSQHLTQQDTRVFGQSYVANTSSVAGLEAFLDEPTDHRHVEYFQSLEKFHERGLPSELPAHLKRTLERDSRLLELRAEVQALTDVGGAGDALNKAKSRVNSYYKTLRRETLRTYQEKWVRDSRDWKILTRGKELPSGLNKNDRLQVLCRLIPERGRLRQIVVADKPLSPEGMWDAMQDIYSLLTRDLLVIYLPGLEPFEGACPEKSCQLDLKK
jgi:hypothetical protein